MGTRHNRSRRVNIPGISAVFGQVVSRAATETLILKRTIFGLMTSFLTSPTRLGLPAIIDLARKIKHADNLRDLGRQFDSDNSDSRLNVLKRRVNLALTIQNLTIDRKRVTD